MPKIRSGFKHVSQEQVCLSMVSSYRCSIALRLNGKPSQRPPLRQKAWHRLQRRISHSWRDSQRKLLELLASQWDTERIPCYGHAFCATFLSFANSQWGCTTLPHTSFYISTIFILLSLTVKPIWANTTPGTTPFAIFKPADIASRRSGFCSWRIGPWIRSSQGCVMVLAEAHQKNLDPGA